MDIPINTITRPTTTDSPSSSTLSRYENQKRRDWNTFCQYLGSHRPPIPLAACTGMHVFDFLRYQDQFGKTKVHHQTCPFFGLPSPPAPCPCPLRQAWGSLDARSSGGSELPMRKTAGTPGQTLSELEV
ncbi:hypothetical protein NL676_030954 [Syzygium grande]|nr:hypothetical protein NL676_030954 [Syzygium grande]